MLKIAVRNRSIPKLNTVDVGVFGWIAYLDKMAAHFNIISRIKALHFLSHVDTWHELY